MSAIDGQKRDRPSTTLYSLDLVGNFNTGAVTANWSLQGWRSPVGSLRLSPFALRLPPSPISPYGRCTICSITRRRLTGSMLTRRT
jgi:hypothetical protein